jgi:prepilin-type N-terminal cleavage/methylation domain-containing protein
MRKAFTLVEIMVVIMILPFVLLLLDGLFGTLLMEIPRSWRIAQESTTLLNLLEQIHQDVGEAKGLPAEFAGRTANDNLLLVELPEGVIGYQIEEGRVTRSRLTSAPPNKPVQERAWSVPNGRIVWQVWQKDGERYAVEIETHVKLESQGRLEKKMARSHLFFAGAL